MVQCIWNWIPYNLRIVVLGGIIAAGIIVGETECEIGYVKIENACVDMCEGINCGIGGNCLSGNCTCQTGYTNVENFCEETCALIPCKELVEIHSDIYNSWY